MANRAYTVSEIDALRRACEQRWLFGTTCLSLGPGESICSRNYKEDDKTYGVEDLVRTYMLAGITAQDIYEEDSQRARQMETAQAEYDGQRRDPHGLRKLMRIDTEVTKPEGLE